MGPSVIAICHKVSVFINRPHSPPRRGRVGHSRKLVAIDYPISISSDSKEKKNYLETHLPYF